MRTTEVISDTKEHLLNLNYYSYNYSVTKLVVSTALKITINVVTYNNTHFNI